MKEGEACKERPMACFVREGKEQEGMARSDPHLLFIQEQKKKSLCNDWTFYCSVFLFLLLTTGLGPEANGGV
jgi:hypothetical protein